MKKTTRTYAVCFDRIAVKPDPPAAQSAGGIHMNIIEKTPPCTGTVMEVGPYVGMYVNGIMLASRDPSAPSVGDRVLFGDQVGIKLPRIVGNDDRTILRYPQEVLAVIVDLEEEDEKENAAKSSLVKMREDARKERQ